MRIIVIVNIAILGINVIADESVRYFLNLFKEITYLPKCFIY